MSKEVTSSTRPGQRERAKAARRQQIMDAAEELIRHHASTDFTMRELALKAGVSHHTSYNLFGSKSAVLYALLNRCLDELGVARRLNDTDGDYIDHLYLAGRVAVDTFTSDPQFYQPLLRYIFGVPDAVHRPAFTIRAYEYWIRAVERLAVEGRLAGGVRTSDLAHDCQVFFNGVLEIWVHGDTTIEQFRNQIRHGLTLRLLALGDDAQRDRLSATLAELRSTVTEVMFFASGQSG